MARVKRTAVRKKLDLEEMKKKSARHSTGGKAPRKQIEPKRKKKKQKAHQEKGKGPTRTPTTK